jgi:hypothetical protein
MKHVVEHLDNGDLHAQQRQQTGELAADVAAAEDDHALRELGQLQQRPARVDGAIRGDEAGDRRCRAGGDDDLVGAEARLSVVAGDQNLFRRDEGSGPGEDLHAVGLEQGSDAAAEALDNTVLAGHHRRVVRGGVGHANAQLLAGAGAVGELGRGDQRLGGYAAAVEAGSPELVLLDQGDRSAELSSTDRGGIATGAAADDDQVEAFHLGVSSRRLLTAFANLAPTAPSTIRWS